MAVCACAYQTISLSTYLHKRPLGLTPWGHEEIFYNIGPFHRIKRLKPIKTPLPYSHLRCYAATLYNCSLLDNVNELNIQKKISWAVARETADELLDFRNEFSLGLWSWLHVFKFGVWRWKSSSAAVDVECETSLSPLSPHAFIFFIFPPSLRDAVEVASIAD